MLKKYIYSLFKKNIKNNSNNNIKLDINEVLVNH